MNTLVKPCLSAGLALLLQPWMHPALADAIDDTDEIRIEKLIKDSHSEEALQASERLRARDLLVALNRSGPEIVGVRVIQRDLLDEDGILLEYLIGKSKSYVWVITSKSFSTFELPPRNVIDPLIYDLHDALAHSYLPAQRGRAELVANQVSAILLKPIASQLAGKRKIILALDGSLQEIPFAVLPDPWNLRVSLLTNHEIVTIPSASVLAALRKRHASRAPPQKLLAILADPVFSEADPRLVSPERHISTRFVPSNSSRDGSLSDLERLPSSRQEAYAISALFPKDRTLIALGFDASRKLATSSELGQFRYLHFATHSIQDGTPGQSGIVLSLFGQNGHRQDGFLDAQAIRSLELSADLVVLSSCRTALGREITYNDLTSLSQSFLTAGAQEVVASLWSVSDTATAQLMELFYRNLIERNSPAAALQKAQKTMSRSSQWSTPYYWAGFVLQGDWR
jgi:CHAT domain-containing protein